MRLPRLDRILAAENGLQPLLAKARELRAIAALVERFLPAELLSQARVANFRDGELAIVAVNAATAAKLRLLGPSLCRFLSNQRGQVSSVLVRVQPNASQRPGAATQKVAQLSTHTLDSLKRVHDTMSDSPARDALRTLLERRGAMPAEKAPPRQRESARKPRGKPRT